MGPGERTTARDLARAMWALEQAHASVVVVNDDLTIRAASLDACTFLGVRPPEFLEGAGWDGVVLPLRRRLHALVRESLRVRKRLSQPLGRGQGTARALVTVQPLVGGVALFFDATPPTARSADARRDVPGGPMHGVAEVDRRDGEPSLDAGTDDAAAGPAVLQDLRKALDDYSALARFGAEIETIHDPTALMRVGLEVLVEHLGCDFGTVLGVPRSGRILEVLNSFGPSSARVAAAYRSIPVTESRSLVSESIRRGSLIHVEDYPASPWAFPMAVASGVSSVLALPVHSGGRVSHVVSLGAVDTPVALGPERLAIVRAFGARLENALERAAYVTEVAQTREATLRSLGLALEFRDLETRGHTDRVVALALAFGREIGLRGDELTALQWGAYLHDLGKVAIPDQILLKPGRLDEHEFALIARHTLFGVEMCRDLRFLPAETLEVVRSHHERWDGSGYPDRLKGAEIPLMARLFALVDVYDALRSVRPYKPAWSPEAARQELANQAGVQFDAELTSTFLALVRGVEPAAGHAVP